MSKENNSSSGIGFLGLLAIAFIVLKLTGFINWSWWWVTLPLWGGFALLGVFMLLGLLGIYLDHKRRKANK